MITLSKILLTFALTYYMVWSLYVMSRKSNRRVADSFFIYLLLGVASLFYPGCIFMMPLLWIAQVILNVFDIKIFLATILGALLPWIWVFSFRFLYNKEILNSGEPYDFFMYDGYKYALPQVLQTATCLVLISCMVYYNNHLHHFKAKVRDFLQVLILLTIGALFLSVVFPTQLIYWISIITTLLYVMIRIFIRRR